MKICPFLLAGGRIEYRCKCGENCALYDEESQGCVMAALAKSVDVLADVIASAVVVDAAPVEIPD